VKKIYGNTQFNTQVILSNKLSRGEAAVLAKNHNITIFSDEDCVDKLKEHYQIVEDIMIVKTEEKILDISNQVNNRVTLLYYNLNTRGALDKNICKSTSTSMKMPITLSPEESAAYQKYKKMGIDIFNATQFNRISCYTYSNDDSGVSLTNLINNRTECSQSGCTHSGLSDDGLLNCNCDEESQTNSTDAEFGLLSCVGEVGVQGSNGSANIGLIVAIVLLLSQIGLTAGMMYYRKNKQNNLDQIIKQDYLTSEEKSIAFFNSHFLKKRASVMSTVRLTQSKETDDINSSRNLNHEGTERKNELKLKDEDEKIQPETVEEKKVDEIHIHNNFANNKNVISTSNDSGNRNTIIEGNTFQGEEQKPRSIITMRDYEFLSLYEMFLYDKRSTKRYILDSLIRRNKIFSIFFKHSITEPIYIRVANMIFCISLLFGTNALFIQSPILNSVNAQNKVKFLINIRYLLL
jgi:hypothetical protein